MALFSQRRMTLEYNNYRSIFEALNNFQNRSEYLNDKIFGRKYRKNHNTLQTHTHRRLQPPAWQNEFFEFEFFQCELTVKSVGRCETEHLLYELTKIKL